MRHKLNFALPLALALLAGFDASAAISGSDLATAQPLRIEPGKKGTVVVFLSAKCPCSDAHLPVLKKMAADFKDFHFVAVHSNADETLSDAQKYFAKADLPFPVLQDNKARIADELKALKTPHAYLLNPEGKIVYKGGVTSSASGSFSDKQYLRNALTDVSEGREVQLADTRTLGCVIAR